MDKNFIFFKYVIIAVTVVVLENKYTAASTVTITLKFVRIEVKFAIDVFTNPANLLDLRDL